MIKKLMISALLLSSCGTDHQSDLDIVNGENSGYRQFYARVGGCGSSLVAPRWLASAKHCGNPSRAIVGLYSKDAKNGGYKKEEIKIIKIVKHPSRDLQLLKLERRSTLKPIPMTDEIPMKKDQLVAFGFGNTTFNGRGPNVLQGAVFYYDGRGAREGIIRASNRPNQAVCHGDSGGPLLYRGKLLATITFTEGNCSIYGSMGFTLLDKPWIKSIIGR